MKAYELENAPKCKLESSLQLVEISFHNKCTS